MQLWTAFLLGLVGSLHCAGMCGPLALAIPGNIRSTARFLLGRLAYNFGRILAYCALGALFGLIGKSVEVIGLQRWISLGIGILILLILFAGTRGSLAAKIAKPIGKIKAAFAILLKKPSFASTLFLGLLNGLLPCGLVYAACAAATTTSGVLAGMSYMAAFGLGTVPMMLAIGIVGKKFQFLLRFKLEKLIPATLILMSVLLILRGLALGIPYLSPDLASGGACCHP